MTHISQKWNQLWYWPKVNACLPRLTAIREDMHISVNSLWPSDVIWWHRSGSTLALDPMVWWDPTWWYSIQSYVQISHLSARGDDIALRLFADCDIWVRSQNFGCLVTWFCYQLIAKPGNKTATVSWPDPYIQYQISKWPGGATHLGIRRQSTEEVCPEY